jgi:hypothetical protein
VDGTIVIGAIGLVTTLLAPLLTTWMTARREKFTWRRDKQTSVYVEAMAYAQTLESRVERVTDPDASWQPRPELTHVDLITARLRMFAPRNVFNAWKSLLHTEEAFVWNIGNEFPALGTKYGQGEAVPRDHRDVVRLKADIDQFYDVMTKILGS